MPPSDQKSQSHALQLQRTTVADQRDQLDKIQRVGPPATAGGSDPRSNLECAGRAQRRRRFGFLRKLRCSDLSALPNTIAYQFRFRFIGWNVNTKAPSPLCSAGALQKGRALLSLLLIWILYCQSLAAPFASTATIASRASTRSAKRGSSPTVREGSHSTTIQPNYAPVNWVDRLLRLFHSGDEDSSTTVGLLPTAPADCRLKSPRLHLVSI